MVVEYPGTPGGLDKTLTPPPPSSPHALRPATVGLWHPWHLRLKQTRASSIVKSSDTSRLGHALRLKKTRISGFCPIRMDGERKKWNKTECFSHFSEMLQITE